MLERGYKYIARMDADDISYPDRFAKQVAFLERHPEVGALGAWGRHFSETTGDIVMLNQPPPTSAGVRNKMFFNSPIINASALIRADAFHAVGPYSVDYPAAEDYELYRRIATRYALANVPELLIDIRKSIHGISLSKRRQQVYDRLRIQDQIFRAVAVAGLGGCCHVARDVGRSAQGGRRAQDRHPGMIGVRNFIFRGAYEALYFSGLSGLLRPSLGGVGSVLTLHHVRPARPDRFQPNRFLEITPDFLDAAIRRLHGAGFDLVSMDELCRR